MDRLAQRIKEMIAEMPDNLTLEEKEAIARHNLQMEKTLGITKGKPMTVEEADKQNANPKHKEQFIPDLKGYTRTNRETDSQRTRISNLQTDNMESTARLVRRPMP